MTALRLGFLASHTGSSLRAIVAAIAEGALEAEAALVVSNNADAPALAFAREQGLPARHLSATTEGSPEAADRAIAEAMTACGADLIVMSGYLRKLGPETLRRFEGRVLNIHPALLPRHGGQGMYGRRVHEAVLRDGDGTTGATVHLVDAEYDHGPPLLQAEVPVLADDTVDTLQARVMALEPELYLQVLGTIVEGRKMLAAPAGGNA
jgi:phosphoribosylglycinamide formyltransferase-1